MNNRKPFDMEAARRGYIIDFCYVGSLPPLLVSFIYKGETFKILQKVDEVSVKCESEKRVIHLPVQTIVVHPTYDGKPVDYMQLESWGDPNSCSFAPLQVPIRISLN